MHTMFAFLWISELQFRGSFIPWVAILLGMLGAGAVIVLYVKESAKLPLLPRLGMAGVRTGIVVLIAFLLMRPVWVAEEKRDKKRPVAVLIDVSQSMDSADPRPSNDDQARAAIAFGLIDADKGLPGEALSSSHEKTLERPKRIEVARAALTNPKLDLFKRLSKVGPLEVYTFGMQRFGQDSAKDDWLKDLKATEPKTALVESAFELLNRDDGDAPAAIVIVTDGRENAGPKSLADLATECNRRNVPLFVYGVGSSAFGQLQVAFGSGAADKDATGAARVGADADAPTTLFVDDITTIPVRYTVKGITEGTANIVLKYGDREVATKKETFTLTPEELRNGKTFGTQLKFIPTKTDATSKKQEYSVSVSVTPAGSTAAIDTLTNNISRPSQVVDRKLKLLWVEGLPRRDFQFLLRDLLANKRIDAKFYLTDGDRAAMRSGPPWMVDFTRELNGTLNIEKEEFRKILFDFDLIIIGDVPGRFFTKDHQEVIKEFVKEGGGLIHIAGRWQSPAAWASEKGSGAKRDSNPIADVLPVEFDAVKFPIQALENPVGFVPVLAPGANRTQIVSLEDDPIDNAERWGKRGSQSTPPNEKQLKPLYWYYPVTKVKPAADVFLVHPTARTPAPDNKEMPLLVGHYFGKGYVLYVGFDDTWRWRFNAQSKLTGRLWTQAIYSAGIPRIVGTKMTQISSNTVAPVLGTTGEYYVRVFNDKFEPFTAEVLEGTLEKVDADPNDKDRLVPVKFHKVPGVDGEYTTTLPYNRVGQFRLTVDPKNKSPASLNFPVNYPDNHELSPGALDELAMRKLTRESRGQLEDSGFYREETLFKLPDEVKPQTAPLSSRKEVLLWNQWMMLALFGLLTLEWFLRKFNGLS